MLFANHTYEVSSSNYSYKSSSSSLAPIIYGQDSGVWLYVAPLLISFGVVENAVSVLVLSQRTFSDMPSRWTLIALSVTDSVVLSFGLIRYWLVAAFKFHPNEINNTSCKVISFILFTTSHISSSLVALVSVERWLAVHYPHSKYRYLCDKYGCFAIWLMAVVVNLHVLWTTILTENPQHKAYTSATMNSSLHQQICVSMDETIAILVDVVDMFFLFFLPFCIILMCNMAIVINLRRRRQRLTLAAKIASSCQYVALATLKSTLKVRLVAKSNEDLKNDFMLSSSSQRYCAPGKKRNAHVTRMLLLVTTTFFLCNFPFAIVHIVCTLYQWNATSIVWNHIWLASYILVYTNNCLNFPIYVISQPKFYNEMCQLMCRCKKKTNPVSLSRASSVQDK